MLIESWAMTKYTYKNKMFVIDSVFNYFCWTTSINLAFLQLQTEFDFECILADSSFNCLSAKMQNKYQTFEVPCLIAKTNIIYVDHSVVFFSKI